MAIVASKVIDLVASTFVQWLIMVYSCNRRIMSTLNPVADDPRFA